MIRSCIIVSVLSGFLALGGPIAYVSTAAGPTAIPPLLGRVDLETGAFVSVGPTVESVVGGTTAVQFQDIAFRPGGMLYGVTNTALYQIDPLTGNSLRVGFLNAGVNVNSLEFRSDGTLFTSGQGQLFTVNPGTGLAALVGSTLPYSSSGDLAFLGGTLYMTAPQAIGSGSGDRLVTLNPATGSPLLKGATGFDSVSGLVALQGVLYGFSNTIQGGQSQPELISIDPTTGQGALLFNVFDGHVDITGGRFVCS